MKKHLFSFALLGCMIFANIACGSDDESEPGAETTEVDLPTVKYADQAVQFTLATPLASNGGSAQTPKLNGVSITEAGKAIFEVATEEGLKYVSADVTINQDVYTVSGNAVGTIKRVAATANSRAQNEAHLDVNVKISKSELAGVEFTSGSSLPATATTGKVSTGGKTLSNLARTWNVIGTVIKLEGDVSLFKTFTGGSLAPIRDEAIRQGAEMKDEEKPQFDKSIETVVFDKNGLLSINYDNGTSDVAAWQWANTKYDKISFTFKEAYMGNKYIPENTTADLTFKDDMLNLEIYADVKGSKNYQATLTLRLKSAK